MDIMVHSAETGPRELEQTCIKVLAGRFAPRPSTLPDDIQLVLLALVMRRGRNRRGFWKDARLVSRGWRAMHDSICTSLATVAEGYAAPGHRHLKTLLLRLPILTHLDIPRVKLFRRSGTTSVMATVATLPRLSHLTMHSACLTDEDLASLAALTGLTVLDITGNIRLTDSAVEHLTPLTSLTALNSGGTSVTRSGRASLMAALPKLTWCL